MNIDIRNCDCFDLLSTIESESIDCIAIDPPYTNGDKENVLGNHKIQTKIDIPLLMQELFRVAKKDCFFAFFGQMPTIFDWYSERY